MGGEMTIEDLKRMPQGTGLGDLGQNQSGAQYQPQPEHVCPTCGGCPTCGRRYAVPYNNPWAVPMNPYYGPNYIGDLPGWLQWGPTCGNLQGVATITAAL